jgi:NADH dehydrogenase
MTKPGRPRIVIIGAGFGGLATVRALRHVPVDVLLVDRHNYHAFLPLLYQVATSGLTSQDIAHPVRSILRGIPNARFRLAAVVGADLEAKRLETVEGDSISYDVLVIAAGSMTESYGIESVEKHAFGLHEVEEAERLRNHVLGCLERAEATIDAGLRERELGFVVVGGGPTGVETAGALAELRRHVVPHDFPTLAGAMRVMLLEGRDALLAGMPPRLREKALEQVRSLGVEVRFGAQVERVERDGVWLRDGELLPARTVVWAAGVRGAALGAQLGLAQGRAGRIPVGPSLEHAQHPDVYVIGDLAQVAGAENLPQVAPVALQQGELVAENVARRLRGEEPRTFVYVDRGTMATIGRNRAVAHAFGLELSGRLAWWAWLFVHILFLVGFRNRVSVFWNWAWNFFTYDRGLRAMIGAGSAAHEIR